MDQWCTHQSSDGLRLLNTKEHGTRTIEEIRASRIEDSRGTADYSRGAGQRGHQWARGSAGRRRGAVATRRRNLRYFPKRRKSCNSTGKTTEPMEEKPRNPGRKHDTVGSTSFTSSRKDTGQSTSFTSLRSLRRTINRRDAYRDAFS